MTTRPLYNRFRLSPENGHDCGPNLGKVELWYCSILTLIGPARGTLPDPSVGTFERLYLIFKLTRGHDKSLNPPCSINYRGGSINWLSILEIVLFPQN